MLRPPEIAHYILVAGFSSMKIRIVGKSKVIPKHEAGLEQSDHFHYLRDAWSNKVISQSMQQFINKTIDLTFEILPSNNRK